ncbi:MAG: hypothetical protein QOG67_3345 [Verrucomicrobiota bacterium]|jgi:hypothetical protein
MTTRIFIAGILGGVAMFIWTSIAHMALPLGKVGVREIPGEEAVLSSLKTGTGETAAFYIFPGLGVGPNATREQTKEAMKQMAGKYANNPSGILVYHPAGRSLALGKLLGVEFATEMVEAILAIWLLLRPAS